MSPGARYSPLVEEPEEEIGPTPRWLDASQLEAALAGAEGVVAHVAEDAAGDQKGDIYEHIGSPKRLANDQIEPKSERNQTGCNHAEKRHRLGH